MSSRFKIFYSTLFLTTLLPYLPFIFPFISGIFGFNLTGWAWLIILLVSIINLFRTKTLNFPIIIWLPWLLYMVVYIIIDFSFSGLQLTLQYTLPILIGISASGFTYTEEDLEWLFKWFSRLIGLIYIMFIFGYLFKGGYGPSPAPTSMLFTIPVSILTALFFVTGAKKYLVYAGILFLASIFQVTRMGIAATSTIFILHFANTSLKGKLIYGSIGFLVFLLVFSSSSFQKKTFYAGQGSLKDITMNYYDNQKIRSTGRISWKKALDPGLKAQPIWGNGPRADNVYLGRITNSRGGEAHNDYLSVKFNYGYAGLGVLLFGFFFSFISVFQISKKYQHNWFIWLISTTVLTLFCVFLMFMYSDNILKYTIYFPNYFFALIGIVYSLKKNEDLSCYSTLQ